jgi:hypothetical protein
MKEREREREKEEEGKSKQFTIFYYQDKKSKQANGDRINKRSTIIDFQASSSSMLLRRSTVKFYDKIRIGAMEGGRAAVWAVDGKGTGQSNCERVYDCAFKCFFSAFASYSSTTSASRLT